MLDAKIGRGDGLGDLVRRMTSGRYKSIDMRGVVPDKESQGSSCNISSKNVRLIL